MRYALGALAPVAPQPAAPSELPEGYGTRRLFLAARDPHWLYASWDLTPEQQRELNLKSRHGHLVLRVFAHESRETVVPEVHVNPESRTFFVNVPHAETRYHAELGLYAKGGKWETVSVSSSTFTPPDAPARETSVEFATIPAQISFETIVETVQHFAAENKPLLEAVIAAQEAQQSEPPAPIADPLPASATPAATAHAPAPATRATAAPANAEPTAPREPEPPAPTSALKPGDSRPKNGRPSRPPAKLPVRVERAETWTPERTLALAKLISIDSYRRVWMGSIEITELVRRQLEEEISSIAAAERARAAAPELPAANEAFGISSALGGPEAGIRRDRKFWFKVNAELILYGATEPDARVTIAGRTVRLRPDGTFSFRFALPDGRYNLPAAATSADQVETREAILEFSRSTEYHGQIEQHPQDPGLRTPRPENL